MVNNVLYCKPQQANDTLFNYGRRQLIYDNIDSAITIFNNIYQISKNNNNEELTLKSLFLLSDSYRKKNNFKTSKLYFNKVDTTILIKHPNLKADYLFRKGKLEKNRAKSIAILRAAIKKKQLSSQKGITSLSNYYNGIATTFLYMSENDSAIKYYDKAIEIEKKTPYTYTKDFYLAAFYLNKGIINAGKSKYQKAIKYFRQSISLLENQNNNTVNIARYNANLGRLYFLTFQFDSAEICYSKAEKIYTLFNKHNRDAGILYLNMGGLYTTTNNVEKALRYLNKAKYIFEGNDRYSSYSKKISLNLGVLHENKKEYFKAIELYHSILPTKSKSISIKAYRNLGTCYSKLSNNDSSLFYFNKAISQAQRYNKNELALSYQYLGDHYSKIQNEEKALSLYNKAIAIYKQTKSHKDKRLAYVYLSLAQHYRKYHHYREAIKHADIVLSKLSSEIDSLSKESYLKNNKIELNRLSAKATKARSYSAMGIEENNNEYLLKAYNIYKDLLSTIEFIRINYQHEENKLTLAEKAKTEYSFIIRTLKALYENTGDEKYNEELFIYMEKSKSAILLTSINDSRAHIKAGIPMSITKKESSLKNKIASYKRMSYELSQKKPDSPTIAEWEDKIHDLQIEYENLVQYLEDNYENYYRLKYNPTIVDIHTIENTLQSNQTIIEYTVTADAIFVFIINNEKSQSFEIQIQQDTLNKLIKTFRNSLTIKDFANFNRKEYNNFVSSSRELYDILLKPFENIISDKELIIVPDNKLGYIPFGILLTEDTDTSNNKTNSINYKDLPYLLLKHPISYAYSASLLFEENLAKNPKYRKVLSVAPSYDNVEAIHVDSLFKESTYRNILLPIPGVKDEVENISNIYSSRKLMDSNATEKAFVKEAPKYGILHLAMHTILNDEFPMFSKLIFYQNDRNNDDGLLNTYEIFDLKLHAELAVLSACNTGYGKLRSGEGIISLARGFIYAGVPSIVMTLWPIEDHATSDIMKLLYENLASGMRKNYALRKAKIDFLKNADQLRSHPHFWGSIVSIGITNPITSVRKANNTYYYMLSAILALLLIGIFLFIRKK